MSALDALHQRLAAHFAGLAKERRPKNRALFALEHGLDASELAELQGVIRRAALRGEGADFPLPWIVYATEIGYRYSGYEFWQTFEEETPGWTQYWDRGWLRWRFRWFSEEFGGVEPVGAWARHFSIICWPIVNAILPRDLQVQLARVLYSLSHRLTKDLLSDSTALGKLIASHAWDTSPRFQYLAEESLLIGQIATALLLEGQEISASLILPSTLTRIGADLEQEQQSKEWLRRARGAAVDRLRKRGFATGSEVRSSQHSGQPSQNIGDANFMLRPNNESGGWDVLLELPNFAPLVDVMPEARRSLLASRCVVTGAAGHPLARGRVTQGRQRIQLSRWPGPGEVLVRFEETAPALDAVLRARLGMTADSLMLFRIATDELAYQVKSRSVRAAQRYVLVQRSGASSSAANDAKIQCSGVVGSQLTLPSLLSRQDVDALVAQGLTVEKGLWIAPAGLTPLGWDGEGTAEVLLGHDACFVLRADHAISALVAEIGGAVHPLGSAAEGEAVYFSVQLTDAGKHQLRFRIRERPESTDRAVGVLDVLVRAPQPWDPNRSINGPILVDVDPPKPTLEQLREGQASIHIRGAEGTKVACTARFYARGQDHPVDVLLPPITLPVFPGQWTDYLQSLFAKPSVEDLYDAAVQLEIRLDANELGNFSLTFEREQSAIRWSVQVRGKTRHLRLLGDLAEDNPVTIGVRDFERPDVEKVWSPKPYLDASAVGVEGGLYVARVGDHLQSAIVIAPEVRRLENLGVSISLIQRGRSVHSALTIVEAIGLWGAARLAGNLLSGVRQRAVIRTLTRELMCVVIGSKWESLEDQRSLAQLHVRAKTILAKPIEQRLVEAIITNVPLLEPLSGNDRSNWLFQQCAAVLGMKRVWLKQTDANGRTVQVVEGEATPNDPNWLCEFCLRMASDPSHGIGWTGDQLSTAISALLSNPAMMRFARFMVLALDVHRSGSSSSQTGSLYSGWLWE